ncbi:MAG: DMT family transporter [Thermoplasmatota archaeon]
MKGISKAYLLGLAAVLIWSTVASAFKLTLDHADPLSMVLLASVVSTMVLMLVLLFRGKLTDLGRVPGKDIGKALMLGVLNPFLYYIVLFSAYDILKAQEAQALNYTWPIILTVLSVIVLGQRISKLQIAAVFIAFLGMFVISSRGSFFLGSTIAPLGILLGLLSALIWASFWTLNIKSRLDDDIKLFLNFVSGSVLIMAVVLLRGGLEIGTGGIAGSAYIGIFEMGVTFIIWLKALKISGAASKISNLIYLGPFISLLFIRVLVGEHILLTTMIGLLLIVLGIAIQRFDDRFSGQVR